MQKEAISRMAENQPKARFKKTSHYVGKQSPKKYYKCAFPAHRKDNINHTTEECKEFQEAPYKWKEWEIPTVEGNQCLLQMLWKSSQTKLSMQSPM